MSGDSTIVTRSSSKNRRLEKVHWSFAHSCPSLQETCQMLRTEFCTNQSSEAKTGLGYEFSPKQPALDIKLCINVVLKYYCVKFKLKALGWSWINNNDVLVPCKLCHLQLPIHALGWRYNTLVLVEVINRGLKKLIRFLSFKVFLGGRLAGRTF